MRYSKSIVSKIFNREICNKNNINFNNINFEKIFDNYRVKQKYVINKIDCISYLQDQLRMLNINNTNCLQISEIINIEDYIFTLTISGYCCVFFRNNYKKNIMINDVSVSENIRSIIYNKNNNTLIIMYLKKTDKFSKLFCRFIEIDSLKSSNIISKNLFENDMSSFPGFIEVDTVNKFILTFCHSKSRFRLWNMEDYSLNYTFTDSNINEIKLSPGLLTITYQSEKSSFNEMAAIGLLRRLIRRKFKKRKNNLTKLKESYMSWENTIKIKTLNIKNKKIFSTLNIPILEKIEFIEQLNQYIFIKEESKNCKILDCLTMKENEISNSIELKIISFLFNYQSNNFIIFKLNGDISIMDCKCNLILNLDNHKLFNPSLAMISSCFVKDNKYIISPCKNNENHEDNMDLDDTTKIHISNTHNGKCINKIDFGEINCDLKNLSSCFYDKNNFELYTGFSNGEVIVIGN